MKRRKCVAMLVLPWVIVVVVTIIDMAEGVKTCLRSGPEPDPSLSLEIFIDTLNGHNGNCSCSLQKVNVISNVTITVNNVAGMCEVGELTISDRNVCDQVKKKEPTWTIQLARLEDVFLNVTGNRNQSVGGVITFTSQNDISLACLPAVETIPETTTPKITTTPITTTTTEGPIEGTLLATSFGVFGGFVILLIPIFLCVRYRERRREKHNAKKANAEQSVQAV
ncbi:uncharacterized protein LOC124279755 [Haliotis rubra]|uniref:uncharacterized protein LOC124279755 n=1 Tax=Haliotis rubra TaxID=36100 RepID=UPI001EE62C91|nr:uncharacterized protein LOC124279755 [Haliotis rubra]